MDNHLRILTLEINGRAERIEQRQPAGTTDNSGKIERTVVAEPSRSHGLASELNAQAGTIAEKIERDLRNHLPPHVSAQASLQFESGSLIVTGTITLLSWVGPIVVDALKSEVEAQLARLVRGSVQRVLQPWIAADFGAMTMDVVPRSTSTGGLISEASAAPGARTTSARSLLATPPVPHHRGLYAAVFLIGLLQLVMIFDHFFELNARPSASRPTTAKVSAAVPELRAE